MTDFQQFRLGDAMNQGQQLAMNQYRLGEAQRGIQARQGLTSALQTGTPEAMTQYSQQFPEQAAEYQKTQGGLREQQIKEALLHVEVVDKLMSGVNDEQSYQRALGTMKQAGMDTSKVPQNYDPNYMAQKKQEALGYKGQLEEELKKSQIAENKGKANLYNAQASAGNATATPSASLDTAAEVFRKTGKLPPNMGRGVQGAAQATAIRNRAAEMDAAEGIDPAESASRQARFGVQLKSEKDFATGKQGNSVRSFNVAINHLGTLESLADALNNGNVQLVNKLGNAYATATGSAAPTNFESAKKIVADEIVKAIVGAGGGVADREEASKTIQAASSPAQLKGVIGTYKELMVGQLSGLHDQYKATTGNDDFETKYLSEAARDVYSKKKQKATETTKSPGGAKPIGDYFK